MKVTFYFVRHGETLFNRKGRIQGVSDSPLTENGIRQAERAAEALKDIYFDRAYTSPAERAVDTAEIILAGRKISAAAADGLHEVDFGRFEGTRFTSHPEEIRQCFEMTDFSSVDGESGEAAAGRLEKTLESIVRECDHEDRVLLVSHGLAEILLVRSLMGVDLNEALKKRRAEGRDIAPNGGIMAFTWEDGICTMLTVPEEPEKFQPPAEDKTVHFIYVRHGETRFNMWNRMQGSCDSPLTAQGIAQAEMSRDALRHTHIDRIYSSPSGRTLVTARIIAGPHLLEPIREKGLKEVNFGDFDGIVRDSWQAEIQRRHTGESWDDAGGENREQVRSRIRDTLKRITARAKDGETILLVSHGAYYLNILEMLFGMDRKTYFESCMAAGRQAMPNGGIFTFDYVSGEYKVVGLMTSPELFGK